MSNYTITLKRISEVYSKNEVLGWFQDYSMGDYLTYEESTLVAQTNLFDKGTLANMIFDHYYLREIAYETPEMFRHYTKVKLREIMGKYLPLVYSYSFRYNPLLNETLNITETFTRSGNDSRTTTNNGTSSTSGTSNSESTSNSSNLQVNSDTPQGQISKADILSGSYASQTSASENETSVNDETTTSSSNTLSNTESLSGTSSETSSRNRSGFDLKMTKADLIANYRKNIINIYNDIIEELNPLFFALY